MPKVIKFNTKQELLTAGIETILWFDFPKKSDGTRIRVDLLKNKETKEVAFGIIHNYTDGQEVATVEEDEIIILGDDEDDFIYNKLTDLVKDL